MNFSPTCRQKPERQYNTTIFHRPEKISYTCSIHYLTGQNRGLSGLKNIWPVIMTGDLLSVVREMGSLAQSSNLQNCIKRTNKIPEYARDFKKEWLTIRGLNKECGNFIGRLHSGRDLFNSPPANRLKKNIREILKAEELGKIKDISSLIFKYFDVSNIECLEEQLGYYFDLYINLDSLKFDQV